MPEDRKFLKRRATTGVFLLGGKRIITQVFISISSILLARLLFPEDFGTFATVQFVITIFSVFGDVGFGPALIQKKTKIEKSDLNSVFTFQILLSLAVILLIWVASPYIASFYNLGEKAVLLFRLTSLAFLFNPIDSIAGSVLERNLEYKKLVISEFLEVGGGAIISVLLAFSGFGVFSLAVGYVASRFFAALSSFWLSRWEIGIEISKGHLLPLLKFGWSFQANTFTGLFYGPLVLLYLGKQVGPQNLGYYQFAAGLSVFTLAFSDIINRLIFPVGSRTQQDAGASRKIVENSIMIISLTSLPLAAFIIAAGPQIIHFVYTDRWLPALPAVYLGVVQMLIVAYTGIFSQMLLARGRSYMIRNMGVFWAVLTWILAPFLIEHFNFVGMSLTGLLVSASGILMFFILRGIVKFSLWSNLFPYLASSFLCAALVYFLINNIEETFLNFVIVLVAGGTFYLLTILFLAKQTYLLIKSLVTEFRIR